MSDDLFEVTAEEILKVAHWVYDNNGDESIWKALQGYAEEKEREEARALRYQIVAQTVCHKVTGKWLDQADRKNAERFLEIGQAVIADLDEENAA